MHRPISHGKLTTTVVCMHAEADQRRRHGDRGVRDLTDGVRAGEPSAAGEPEWGGLGAGHGVPEGPERSVQGAQRAAEPGADGARRQVPRRADHLRRPVRARDRLRGGAGAVRVRRRGRRAEGLLRREIQLQPERRVRQPVGVRQLGRRPPHRGGVPPRRRWLAQGTLRAPAHSRGVAMQIRCTY